MPRAAPPWAQVKLRVSFGDIPPFGAVLQMRTGRRYQVIGVNGRALRALVLPPEATVEDGTLVWDWQWAKRDRKRRAA